MTEGVLFAIGSVVFIMVSAAILWYGYARFNEVYERDQVAAEGQALEGVEATGSNSTDDRAM